MPLAAYTPQSSGGHQRPRFDHTGEAECEPGHEEPIPLGRETARRAEQRKSAEKAEENIVGLKLNSIGDIDGQRKTGQRHTGRHHRHSPAIPQRQRADDDDSDLRPSREESRDREPGRLPDNVTQRRDGRQNDGYAGRMEEHEVSIRQMTADQPERRPEIDAVVVGVSGMKPCQRARTCQFASRQQGGQQASRTGYEPAMPQQRRTARCPLKTRGTKIHERGSFAPFGDPGLEKRSLQQANSLPGDTSEHREFSLITGSEILSR